MNRRSILQLLGTAAMSLGWRPSVARAQAAPLDAVSLGTLRALAPAVLPTTIGPNGADKVVDDFLAWLRAYKSGADMGYGYGILRKRVTPTITPAAYREQLAGLERAARSSAHTGATGGSFATRSLDERRALAGRALDEAGIKTFPGIPDGRNVIADLMGFYFNSSEANDLCHQVKIGRDKCRTLAGSSQRPERITSA